jgi:catechol 2,3-dioxygenase-like lactoylglutathione lyase family enzyme
MLIGIDHVQLAMPPGQEATAEAFYAGILGLKRVAKPPALEVRGGCWFEREGLKVHLGVEEPFQPARKAHPALRVETPAALDELAARLGEVRWDEDLPGFKRFYVDDPFGNRIELLAPLSL